MIDWCWYRRWHLDKQLKFLDEIWFVCVSDDLKKNPIKIDFDEKHVRLNMYVNELGHCLGTSRTPLGHILFEHHWSAGTYIVRTHYIEIYLKSFETYKNQVSSKNSKFFLSECHLWLISLKVLTNLLYVSNILQQCLLLQIILRWVTQIQVKIHIYFSYINLLSSIFTMFSRKLMKLDEMFQSFFNRNRNRWGRDRKSGVCVF